MRRRWAVAAVAAVVSSATGCGTADCTELCGQAQEDSCVWVAGDCARWCDAVDALGPRAGCDAAAADVQSCLEDGEVCAIETRCQPSLDAYEACVAESCAANPTDADCMVVEAAR